MPRITYACADSGADLLVGDPCEPDHSLDVTAFTEDPEETE